MKASNEETDDDDFIEWVARFDRLHFDTKFYTDTDGTSEEVKEDALERLIEGLQSGEIEPRWNVSRRSRDTIHSHAKQTYALACPRCKTVDERETRELIVDDEIQVVCQTCAEELKNICNDCKRHRDDLEDDESITVDISRQVSEFLCSTCYAEDKPTVEP